MNKLLSLTVCTPQVHLVREPHLLAAARMAAALKTRREQQAANIGETNVGRGAQV